MISNENSTIFLTKDGSIYGIGNNTHGELGLGHNKKVDVPTKINLENVKTVYATKYITYALTNDDKLYVFGYGMKSRKGGIYNYKVPTLINYAPNNIKKILFLGGDTGYPVILTHDGYVYTMMNSSKIVMNRETQFVKYKPKNMNDINDNIVDIARNIGGGVFILYEGGFLNDMGILGTGTPKILESPNIKLLDGLVKNDGNVFFVDYEKNTYKLHNINE